MPRRFPTPWSNEERQESSIVKDANGQALAYLYFEDEPQRQMSMKRLWRDQTRRIAANIAKLAGPPAQISPRRTQAFLRSHKFCWQAYNTNFAWRERSTKWRTTATSALATRATKAGACWSMASR
jgi:hypothetical protein